MADQIVVNIEVETRHNFKYVVVRAMRRELGREIPNGELGKLNDYPLNISPTFAEDLPYSSLELSGSFSCIDNKLTGFYPVYHDAYAVDLRQATAMAKMLAKIERKRVKTDAREAGATYMAFCKAIGAESVAVCLTPIGHIDRAWLTRCQWRWDTIGQGHARLLRLIATEESDRVPR